MTSNRVPLLSEEKKKSIFIYTHASDVYEASERYQCCGLTVDREHVKGLLTRKGQLWLVVRLEYELCSGHEVPLFLFPDLVFLNSKKPHLCTLSI